MTTATEPHVQGEDLMALLDGELTGPELRHQRRARVLLRALRRRDRKPPKPSTCPQRLESRRGPTSGREQRARPHKEVDRTTCGTQAVDEAP